MIPSHLNSSFTFRRVFSTVLLFSAIWMAAPIASLRAAIPAGAISDYRYALGYLVANYYTGVDKTGNASSDSTAGIQAALDDAKANYLNVFLETGTYLITDTLHCYNYELYDASRTPPHKTPDKRAPALVGSKASGTRPVIKLKAGASGFGSATVIKPMLAYRNFQDDPNNSTNSATEVIPANAFTPPATFINFPSELFCYEVRNVDLDCGGFAGAVGLSMDGAQNCNVENVRIDATGAYAGIVGLSGVGGNANIEVEGGRYGYIQGTAPGTTNAAADTCVPTVAGLKLTNQTIAAIVADNYSGPIQAVGFTIKPAAGGVVAQFSSSSSPMTRGTLLLLDGQIDMSNNSGAIAVNNSPGKTLNMRNVYVTGTDNIIKSASQSTIVRTGTWKLVNQYTYTDQHAPAAGDPPYEVDDVAVVTYSIINGTRATTPVEPVVSVDSNASAPPADLLSRHIWSNLPSFEDGPYENPVTYGATPETSNAALDQPSEHRDNFTVNASEDRVAFQAAIDAASAAGHGRVVVPKGAFHLDGPITLHANTQLIGASLFTSVISVHGTWQPTTGTPVLVQTDDDANATTFLGFLALDVARKVGTLTGGVYPGDRFGHLLWRAGQNSMTVAWQATQQFLADIPSNPRALMKLTGNGGGRHYGYSSPGRGTGGASYRCLVFDHTTKPTWFYMTNVEAMKGGGVTCDMNIQMDGAQNVRLFGLKREGSAPTIVMTDCTNVGLFGHENRFADSADIQVLGTSNGILLAFAGVRAVKDTPGSNKILHDTSTTGQPTGVDSAYPESISIYKHGELNDAAVYIGNSLPSPWVTADIGSITLAGSASYSSGTFTVSGSGADIYASADAFRYVYQTWTGDATIIARVATESNTSNWAKAGIMIRKNLTANCAQATIDINPAAGGNGIEFLRRTADGNPVTDNTFTAGLPPRWLKLVRAGDVFTAFHSTNGTSWTQLGSAITIPMGATVNIGLAVCAHNTSALNTSTFDNVSVTGSGTVGPFASEDIGGPGIAGSASLSSGVYTVSGGGADIYGAADQFRFLHQSWTGSGRIVARVVSQSVPVTHNYAKAGLMFRDDTTAGSRNIDLILAPNPAVSGTAQMLQRTTASGTTTEVAHADGKSMPYWLRLERNSGRFTGWHSIDGITWFMTGTTTATLADPARVGLSVTAHDNTKLNTATFDNVSLAALPAWTAADIGSVGSAGSSSVDPVTDVYTVNGAGVNIFGTTDSFHFYYIPWTGSTATIVAEVTSVENTNAFAKGGLMIRQTVSGGSAATSAMAMVDLKPGAGTSPGVEFIRRPTTGGTGAHSSGSPVASIAPPRFLKLVLTGGNTISAYQSADSITWTQVGATETVAFTGTYYIGLASCSIINTTNLCTATFESVYVK